MHINCSSGKIAYIIEFKRTILQFTNSGVHLRKDSPKQDKWRKRVQEIWKCKFRNDPSQAHP